MPQPAILPCSPARGLRRGQCRDLQAAGSAALRLQRLRVQRLAVQVLEHHGQRLAAGVYVELAEELEAFAGRRVGVARAFLENDFAAKGPVHLVGAEAARIQRAGDEFPERVEVLEAGALGAEMVGRRVVHVGREPDHVVDARVLDALEQARHLQLAAPGCAMLAIGHGLPLGAALSVLAIGHEEADGHVAGDQLPGGAAALEAVQQPLHLGAAQHVGVRAFGRLQVVAVGAAVAAHVDHEDVGQRALGQAAVQTLVHGRAEGTHGRVFHEGALAASGQQLHVLFCVARVVGHALAVRVVVGDLVVVPLPDLGDLAAQGAHVGVHEVVAVAAPEFVQRLGHLGDLGRDQVLPQRAVAQLHLRGDGAVGIDGVAAVQEHVGVGPAHGLVDAHAAKGLVDAEALACGVAAPHQAQRPRGGHARRQRRAKVPLHGGRAHIGAGKVLQHHAVEDVLARRQALQVDAARAVAAVHQQVRPAHARGVGKARGGGPFDPHARIAAGARPGDGAVSQHIAALQARGQQRPRRVARDGGGGHLGLEDGGQQRAASGGQQKMAAEHHGGGVGVAKRLAERLAGGLATQPSAHR